MQLRIAALVVIAFMCLTVPAWAQQYPDRAPGPQMGPDPAGAPPAPQPQYPDRGSGQQPGPGSQPAGPPPAQPYPPAQQYPPGQQYPDRGPGPPGGPAGPDQPVQPRIPTITPRAETPPPQQPAPPQVPRAPFTLSPPEEAQLDQVLTQWERRNQQIKTFDSQFKRWTYDVVFADPQKPLQPKFVEIGTLRYAAPDKGLFRLDKEERDGKELPIDNARAEHWLCDGKSVFEYVPSQKKVKEHKLPPELQGKAIANSPLPFLFGAEAKNLKQRYFIRLVTPQDVQGQTWLEAHPRFQGDAANFHHAIFIITTQTMLPYALRIVQPNGKDYMVYQFFDSVPNAPWRPFQGDPFRPFTPFGWQMIPDNGPQQQPPPLARRPMSDGRR
jgi:TIGR03009 family protein